MVPTGGPHLEVRQRERWRGEAGWACWVGWDVGPSGKKKKKEGEVMVGWFGLERKREFVYFVFFKLKHHLNKFHLNSNKFKFGCYR